jgi:hypothetical protein
MRVGLPDRGEPSSAADRRAGNTDAVIGTAGERGDKTGWLEAGTSAYPKVKPYDEGRPRT